MNSSDTQGSCLCGAVTYHITGPIGDITHCHCTTCRKAHASAFSSVASVADSDFKITAANPLGHYESSPGKTRYFCRTCASQIYAKRAGSTHVILRLGTLDSDISALEKNHIWTSQQAQWYRLGDTLPAFKEFE